MEIAESLELIKSLADTSRLRVLNLLLEKSQYVEEIAEKLNLATSTVSFHLKKLEKANLVYKTKEQYYITYHIKEEVLNLPLKEFISFKNLDKYVQDERINQYKQKVINTFIKAGKVIKLPIQHKKRMIILEEVLKNFKYGKKYSEVEVNELIINQYDDYCTVRREMIEEGMMNRENGFYWLEKKPELQNDK